MARPTGEALRAWIEDEIKGHVASGFSVAEAERAVRWLLQNCPPDEDPRAWVPPPSLAGSFAEPGDAERAQAADAWRTDPDLADKWKPLLDALELEDT